MRPHMFSKVLLMAFLPLIGGLFACGDGPTSPEPENPIISLSRFWAYANPDGLLCFHIYSFVVQNFYITASGTSQNRYRERQPLEVGQIFRE